MLNCKELNQNIFHKNWSKTTKQSQTFLKKPSNLNIPTKPIKPIMLAIQLFLLSDNNQQHWRTDELKVRELGGIIVSWSALFMTTSGVR